MFNLRKKLITTVNEPVHKRAFVDLENYEVDGDTTVTRVRVVEVLIPSDIAIVKKQVEKGNILFIDFTGFSGVTEERDVFIDLMKTSARENCGQLFVMNQNSFLITPAGVKVDKLRVNKRVQG